MATALRVLRNVLVVAMVMTWLFGHRTASLVLLATFVIVVGLEGIYLTFWLTAPYEIVSYGVDGTAIRYVVKRAHSKAEAKAMLAYQLELAHKIHPDIVVRVERDGEDLTESLWPTIQDFEPTDEERLVLGGLL